MNYSKIIKYDTGQWDGVNTTLFLSGCTLKCPGCFNSDAQDFNYGQEFDKKALDKLKIYLSDTHVDGLCVLGGEPFDQDLDLLSETLRHLVYIYNKPIHIWSGYTFEDIMSDPKKRKVLVWCDTLVDGRFDKTRKDLMLRYRGSSNQRVIDVFASIDEGRPILCDI